jgi:YfiR/HmsC-like
MRTACLTRVLVLAFALTALISNAAYADTSREYQLKAAYILNFSRFIYWPMNSFSSATDEFSICVYGESPFGENIDYLRGKKVQSRSIKISYKEDLNNVAECHILFVSASGKSSFYEMSSNITQNVLTVSDVEGFSAKGGMIEFIRVNNKIKFIINVTQSIKSGIKYRSQLLEVAEQLR